MSDEYSSRSGDGSLNGSLAAQPSVEPLYSSLHSDLIVIPLIGFLSILVVVAQRTVVHLIIEHIPKLSLTHFGMQG